MYVCTNCGEKIWYPFSCCPACGGSLAKLHSFDGGYVAFSEEKDFRGSPSEAIPSEVRYFNGLWRCDCGYVFDPTASNWECPKCGKTAGKDHDLRHTFSGTGEDKELDLGLSLLMEAQR